MKRVLLWLMAVFYVFAGVNHFRDPGFYLSIMPPWIPAHALLVQLSGVAEVVLGLGLLVPRFRVPSAWGVIAMLILFLPVHVHMLVNAALFPDVPVGFLWARFPIQALLILWAWWYARPETGAAGAPPLPQ